MKTAHFTPMAKPSSTATQMTCDGRSTRKAASRVARVKNKRIPSMIPVRE
jgi:hypothetical protein